MIKGLLSKVWKLVISVVLTLSCLALTGQEAEAQQTQKGITLKMDNARLETVLDAIESQTRYLFLNDQVDLDRILSVNVVNQQIGPALDQVFKGTQTIYKINGTNIYISNKPQTPAQAVSNTVSGTVLDAKGQPVIGAAVLVKGTSVGASTDLDGKFSFGLPQDAKAEVLQFSSLGYETIEMSIGNRRVFNVTLAESTNLLEGTVVTALGIRRSEKALSYNVQEVKSDQLLTNKDANFVNSLNGKVAGLVVNASSSGVGGASKVVMRGQKSISKSSNALYVIDGVPMYTSAREASTEFGSTGTTDPIADINPEDIESMTVLTGAAAAALYGSDAANGAIVVTTKKGQEGKTSVTISSNTEMFNPLVLPSFQNTYGTGDLNSKEGSIVRSWVNKLVKSSNYNPSDDYYKTGFTSTNNVSLATGNAKNQTYLSGASVNSQGNVPNNAYNRYNFSFRNTTNFWEDRMTLDVSANLILQNDRNLTNQGVYNNPVVGAYLFPRGNDWSDIKMYERWDSSRKIFTQYWPVGDAGITMQNPYWINYRDLRTNKKQRYMLSGALSYKILDWMTVSGRVRVDNSYNKYQEKAYATTNTQLTEQSTNGLYELNEAKDNMVYADALLDINKTFGKDWSLHANIGASITDMRYDDFQMRGPIADGIVDPSEAANIPNVFNVFALSQSKLKKSQTGYREQTQSVYASAEVGYKSTYFLSLTGRNDWPSQLAGPRSKNKSFFYPSVGLSVVLSEAFKLPEQIEYLKVRSSFASVGSSFSRFLANPLHSWSSSAGSWVTETVYPMNQLKPEKTNSWEIGLSARMFGMFSLDASWYNTNTKNQTFNPGISSGSGYSEIYIQSGNVLNTGVEVSLGFDKTWGAFGWQSNYTFSANHNEIKSLADNAVNPVTGEKLNIKYLNMGGLGNAKYILKEGGSLGDLYSLSTMKRDNYGNIYVDASGNVATQTISQVADYIKLGSVLPKANMAWRNEFHYGNFNLGAMVTARIGGIVFSRTQAMLDYYGVSQATADARDAGGALINGTDRYDANKWYTAIAGGDTVPEYYTYSATNVRLQEASFGYTFPRRMLGNVCDLTIQLVGRNLFMIYNKAPFDPESVATTSNNYYQGIDYFMMPSTRNYGFNIRIKF